MGIADLARIDDVPRDKVLVDTVTKGGMSLVLDAPFGLIGWYHDDMIGRAAATTKQSNSS